MYYQSLWDYPVYLTRTALNQIVTKERISPEQLKSHQGILSVLWNELKLKRDFASSEAHHEAIFQNHEQWMSTKNHHILPRKHKEHRGWRKCVWERRDPTKGISSSNRLKADVGVLSVLHTYRRTFTTEIWQLRVLRNHYSYTKCQFKNWD